MEPLTGAALKALLYLGMGLLSGAGLVKFWVFEDLPRRISRYLGAAAVLGAAFIILPSLALLLQTPLSILGYADAEFMLEYALDSKEGRWILARSLATLASAGLVLVNLPQQLSAYLFVVLVTSITSTVSFLSHAANRETMLPVLADTLHGLSASFWLGGIMLLALLPVWTLGIGTLQAAMQRLSLVAQLSVALIVITGGYTTLLYIPSFSSLVSSEYGRLLSLKFIFFISALGVAALNHQYFLPRLLASGTTPGFRRALFVELAFLILVIGLTGALTTTQQP